MPAAPPAPKSVDPGKAALDYIEAMANPELQEKLLASEQIYRPQYNELNLADYNTYMTGTDGQMGLLDLNRIGTESQTATNIAASSAQREADIADVERYGNRASSAFLNANPQLAAQLAKLQVLGGDQNLTGVQRGDLGDQLYADAQASTGLGGVGQTLDARAKEFAQSQGQLSAQEMRDLDQGVRGAYASRGRGMGNSAIGAEAYSRLANTRERMMQDLGMAQSLNQGNQAELGANRGFAQGVSQNDLSRLFNNAQLSQSGTQQDRQFGLQNAAMLQGTASDPFMTILGRPSSAPGMANSSAQFAAGLAGSSQGPQLFDPNAGINLGLKNASNQANYQSSIFGAQAGFAGAQAQARGAMIGGALGGIGSAVGGSGIKGLFG